MPLALLVLLLVCVAAGLFAGREVLGDVVVVFVLLILLLVLARWRRAENAIFVGELK